MATSYENISRTVRDDLRRRTWYMATSYENISRTVRDDLRKR